MQYRCQNLHHVHHHIHVLLSTFTNLNLFVGALYSTRYRHVSKEHVTPWQIKVQSCWYVTSQHTRPSSSTDHHLLVTTRTRTWSPSCLEVTDWKIYFKSQCEDKDIHCLTNHMNCDVDMKTMHCFLQSKALYQGPHRFISSAMWPSGLSTGDKWNEVCLQVYYRCNTSGVQIQMRYGVITCVEELVQHINMSTLTESLNSTFHQCFVLYDINTELFTQKQHIFTLKLLSQLKPAGLRNLSKLELSIRKFGITM